MATEHQRLDATERYDLVAYLDGELPVDRARALEAKLTRSVSARREIEALEATWSLLDQLPKPEAPPDFTEQTATLARRSGGLEDRLARAAHGAFGTLLKWAAAAAIVGVSTTLGYAATRWVWPDPTARLARDLTIADRLDAYQEIGSFAFLRHLDHSTVIEEPTDTSP